MRRKRVVIRASAAWPSPPARAGRQQGKAPPPPPPRPADRADKPAPPAHPRSVCSSSQPQRRIWPRNHTACARAGNQASRVWNRISSAPDPPGSAARQASSGNRRPSGSASSAAIAGASSGMVAADLGTQHGAQQMMQQLRIGLRPGLADAQALLRMKRPDRRGADQDPASPLTLRDVTPRRTGAESGDGARRPAPRRHPPAG